MRYLKTVLILLVGFWALAGLASNLGGLGMTYDVIRKFTNMPMFPAGEGPPWRTDSALVIWCGVAMIMLGKTLTATLCLGGAYRMARAVRGDSETFQQAKQWGLLGAAAAVGWLFACFGIFGETIFFMYLDPQGFQVGETAFRYGGYAGLIVLIVSLRD